MSIALSAVVRPSRTVRWALLLYGAGHATVAAGLAAGWIAALAGTPFAAAACAVAAALAGWLACHIGTAHRIDISGIGEVRLTVKQQTGDGPAQVVQLLPGSTLWPCLMCLRFSGPDGRRTLVVAPDSVKPDEFRALAVACRSIAGRDNVFFEKNKIV